PAQHRGDTAVRRCLARVVDEPRGIGLGADRLPDLLLEVRAHRPPGGAAQHQAEDLGLDRGVREPRAPGLLALVEWADGLEAAGLRLQEGTACELSDVVAAGVLLDALHPRR